MVDQPGAGGSRSYKIRGYTRERQSAKPYARPPGRKKGVIETVKDFFSPAWLVDFFKGTQRSEAIEIEDADDQDEQDVVSQRVEQSSNPGSNERASSRPQGVSATSKVGNGQLGTSFGPGYFSSLLRERELSSETPSTSRPSRTIGLSSGDDRLAEASTSSGRSEECESEVPKSRNEEDVAQLETVVEEDLSIVHTDRQERSKSDSIKTSTPALFSTPGIKRRPNTSIFGEPLPSTEASTSGGANTSRPQLFMPLSESRPQPFSLPANRPSFSVAAFGSPIPPQPPQAGGFSSPFYRGRTSFGGASSLHSSGYKRLRTHSPTLGEAPKPVRKVITPKPVSTAGGSGVTSQTAKRILEALETMSSPLIDARKIPTPPISPSASPLSFSPAKRRRAPLPSRAIGSPRSLKAHFSGPPVQDLSAPQQATISQLRAKEAVTPESTATSSGSLFSTATTTIPTFSKPSVSSFTPTPLPVSLSPSSSKAGGKVKSSRSTGHYTQRERGVDRSEDEVVNPIPEVVAPVPLTLPNGKSLPAFSFKPTSQTETKRTSSKNEMPISTATTITTVDLTKNNFKFSSPEAKVPAFSQASVSGSQSSTNKITFSFSQPVPVNKSDADTGNNSNKQGKNITTETKPTEKPVEPNNNLLNKFAPLPGSWTCDTCLVSNKATDTKCVACQSSKPSTGKPAPKKLPPTSNDLMQKFAPPAGTWSCDTCLVDNDASKTKCVACQTPKPGAKPPVVSKPVVNSDQDLMKKFAPPSDSWDCDTCMVQNKSTDSTCVACQTPKPGASKAATTKALPSFGSLSNAAPDNSLAAKFAPPSGSWTCDTCMISNKSEDSTCVACQTPKPGAKPGASTTAGFSLGGGQAFSSSPFKFPVNNSLNANFSSMPSIKFGADSSVDTKTKGESSSSSPFTFGSSTADQSSKTDSKQEESTSKVPATFKFGSSTLQASDSGAGEAKANAIPFSFGSSANSNTDGANKPLNFGVSSSVDKDNTSSGAFKFGANQATPEPANKGKPNSIAAAAASGFLKVPEMNEPGTSEQTSKQTGPGMNIADAAKSGLLKVPTAGEKKVDFAGPPNVNLFAPAQTTTGPSTSKPDTSSNSSLAAKPAASGFSSFAAPSGAPSPFTFGAATPSSTAATSTGDSGSSVTVSKPFANPLAPGGSNLTTFQFGAASSSTAAASSQAASTTTTLAPSPFSFQAANTAAPVKTTAAAASPFAFMANAGGPAAAPTGSFSFGSNATSTTASAGTGTFQFAPTNTDSAGSLKPQPQAPTGATGLFQFGAANAATVTTASTQPPSPKIRTS
ncbi:hypothetical protein ACROYT_G009985 [Oculina patagonica]